MPTGRLPAAWRALVLARRIETLRRAECAALARVGNAVARTSPAVDPRPPAVAPVLLADSRVAALDAAAAASLDQDRADYGVVAGWARPVVIARGLAARVVLRHQRRTALRDLEAAEVDLGRSTLHGTAGLPMAAVPHFLGEEVAAARADLEAALRERATLLAAWGGSLLPRGLTVVGVEAAAFGRAVWAQLRGHLFPRVPTLSGLVVGWWIAHNYTDSHWRATLHRLGFGEGGTRVVSSESYARMRFWLPLLTAAACGYFGSRLAAGIRRRYGTTPTGTGPLPAHDPSGAPAGSRRPA